jgi:hypothetical protein
MKMVSLVLIGLLFGCSSAPIATSNINPSSEATRASALSPQPAKIANLHFNFIDARHDDYKTSSGCFRIRTDKAIRATTCGDTAYDKPLNVVFKDLFLARFPDSTDGYITEIKLTAFNSYWSAHTSEYVAGQFGLLGVLASNVIDANTDYYGICKVDVTVSDKTNKTVFNKAYDAEIHESASRKEVERNGLVVLQKAFQKVAADFENDLKNINIQ